MQHMIALVDIASPLANFAVHNSTVGITRPLSLMYGFPRVSATLVEPSYLATYLLVAWAYWLCTMLGSDSWSRLMRSLFVWSGVFIGAIAVATGSRRGYVVMAVLGAVAVVCLPRRIQRSAFILASVLAGVLLTGIGHARGIVASVVPALPSVVQPAAGQSQAAAKLEINATNRVIAVVARMDQSVQYRTAAFLIAWRVVKEHPLLGGGYGTSGFYMEKYWPEAFKTKPANQTAPGAMLSHYAAVLAETGLLGGLCAVGLVGSVARRLWRSWRSEGGAAKWQVAGVAALDLSYALGAVSGILITYQMLLWCLLLAVSLSFEAGEGA
jgi:O-antigen ligase